MLTILVTEFELETASLPRHHKVDLHCIRFHSRGGLLTSELESIPFMNVSGKFYYSFMNKSCVLEPDYSGVFFVAFLMFCQMEVLFTSLFLSYQMTQFY